MFTSAIFIFRFPLIRTLWNAQSFPCASSSIFESKIRFYCTHSTRTSLFRKRETKLKQKFQRILVDGDRKYLVSLKGPKFIENKNLHSPIFYLTEEPYTVRVSAESINVMLEKLEEIQYQIEKHEDIQHSDLFKSYASYQNDTLSNLKKLYRGVFEDKSHEYRVELRPQWNPEDASAPNWDLVTLRIVSMIKQQNFEYGKKTQSKGSFIQLKARMTRQLIKAVTELDAKYSTLPSLSYLYASEQAPSISASRPKFETSTDISEVSLSSSSDLLLPSEEKPSVSIPHDEESKSLNVQTQDDEDASHESTVDLEGAQDLLELATSTLYTNEDVSVSLVEDGGSGEYFVLLKSRVPSTKISAIRIPIEISRKMLEKFKDIDKLVEQKSTHDMRPPINQTSGQEPVYKDSFEDDFHFYNLEILEKKSAATESEFLELALIDMDKSDRKQTNVLRLDASSIGDLKSAMEEILKEYEFYKPTFQPGKRSPILPSSGDQCMF